jgi:hypothetical protein
MYDYDEHKAEARGAGDNILKQLSSLALDQKRAELEVAQAEEQLALAKARAQAHIAEHVIPELMDAAEMAEYTTKDGIKIKINEKVRGSIPKATEAQAFQWLLDQPARRPDQARVQDPVWQERRGVGQGV